MGTGIKNSCLIIIEVDGTILNVNLKYKNTKVKLVMDILKSLRNCHFALPNHYVIF